MLRHTFTILLTGIILVLGACSEETERKAGEVNDQIESTVESAKEDVEQTKSEFIAEAEEKLEELNNSIQQAENKLREESGEIEKEAKEELDNLKEQRDAIKKDINTLKEASQENWESLKASVQAEIKSLRNSYNNFVEDLKLG